MTITLTVEQALQAMEGINSVKDTKMPSRASYWLGRYKEKLTPILKNFEETRVKLVREKYGVANEKDKELFSVPEENMEPYIKEVTELLKQSESIEVNSQLKVEDFGTAEVAPSFFSSLALFIVE